MKVHASQSPGGRSATRFRWALTSVQITSVQITFSMVLLVLAGLLAEIDPGTSEPSQNGGHTRFGH